mgnify:CR=1 FL=1
MKTSVSFTATAKAIARSALVFLFVLQVSAANQPNILLIVADDLGFSDLGCYGGEIRTPNLDQLAGNGVRLTQFYTTSRCCPSRASILSGQYPHRVGLGHMTKDINRPGYRGRISENAVTIAQVLQGAGYRSFISGKWHLGTEDPTKHGFEEFYGTLVSAKTFWDADHFLRLPTNRKRRVYAEGTFYGTDAITDHALEFIGLARQTPKRPWFLYLAYNSPHFPLHAPKEDIERYRDRYTTGWDAARESRLKRMKELGIVPENTELSPRSPYWNYGETKTGTNPAWDTLSTDRRQDLARRMAIYAAMIDRMDQNIGRLIADLKAKGELENTLIVFTSDNGACAEWDPRGFDGKSSNDNILHRGKELDRMGGPGTYHSAGSGWANASNTPWRLYKHFNHEGGLSAPCIAHWPAGLKRKNAIVSAPAHLIDLMPTIVEASKTTYPKALAGKVVLPMAGQSLLPALEGHAPKDRTLYFEHEGNRAIRDGKWKLVALKGQPWELYNVLKDRSEQKDLAAKQPNRAKTLAKQWDKWASENQVTPLPDDYGVGYLKPVEK